MSAPVVAVSIEPADDGWQVTVSINNGTTSAPVKLTDDEADPVLIALNRAADLALAAAIRSVASSS